MFTTATLPPMFQHTMISSTMALHVPATGYGRYVAIVRTLRDGTTTREYLPERLAELSRYFRNGKTQLEVARTYASGDLVVLVMIERQTGEVGGLP